MTPAVRKEIAAAADDVFDRVRELASPRDAVTALLTAHVRLTVGEEMDMAKVDDMLVKYSDAFKGVYFGDRPAGLQ